MQNINIYKRKLNAILDYIEKNEQIDKEIIKEMKKNNYLTIEEMKQILRQSPTDITDTVLKEKDIYYLILPNKSLFDFQILISLTDGIIAAPCYPVAEDEEWELDSQNLRILNHSDLIEIKDFLNKKIEQFESLVKNHEVELVTKALGGELKE